MADAMTMPGQKMNPNLWWFIAAGGVGLVLVAYIISFFNSFDQIADKEKASEIFRMLGYVAFNAALALMAAMQSSWPGGVRAALMLGAGYFTMMSAMMGGMFRSMLAGMMGGMF